MEGEVGEGGAPHEGQENLSGEKYSFGDNKYLPHEEKKCHKMKLNVPNHQQKIFPGN